MDIYWKSKKTYLLYFKIKSEFFPNIIKIMELTLVLLLFMSTLTNSMIINKYCFTIEKYCPNPVQKKITYENYNSYDFKNIKIKKIDNILKINTIKNRIVCISYDNVLFNLNCPEKIISISNKKCERISNLFHQCNDRENTINTCVDCSYKHTVHESFFY